MRVLLFMAFAIVTVTSCGNHTSSLESLTPPDYTGKKYYFGWGLNDNGNTSMDNEVKYDVLHTNNIFTSGKGGGYIGKKLIGGSEVNGKAIKQGWKDLTAAMTNNDMYLQYSSGHGYPGGLVAGVTYTEMINATLAMPVKETVIFDMACYSGSLVDAFNSAKTKWQDYEKQGRTLFVMASSKASEESSTGPGTDPDEANGPNGSAGSAFGHALWKALIGYADGATKMPKDGTITLDEVIAYVVADTEKVGDHTPVYTGVYNAKLPISSVPTFKEAEAILAGTDGGWETLQTLVNDGVLRRE